MTRHLRGPVVVAWPRDRNPYQAALHRELGALGVRAGYVPDWTRSHTLNVVLLPLTLLASRMRGARILHVHWIYLFAMPYADRWPLSRRLARAWYSVTLATVRILGLRVVWTAHNLLPHGQVFPDDDEARRRLLEVTDAVVVHAPTALRQMADRGWPVPARTAVIPSGPYESVAAATGTTGRADLGLPATARVVGMVGRLDPYKQPDALVAAAVEVLDDGPGESAGDLHVLLAGECPDPELRRGLEDLAAEEPRVHLVLRRLTDDEFAAYLRALDVLVLPFRAITSSGSAIAALNAGVPVLVPHGPPLADLDQTCLLRYDDLADGLRDVRSRDAGELTAMAERALAWSATWTWADAAAATRDLYADVLARPAGSQQRR